jgi:hypothetical protein
MSETGLEQKARLFFRDGRIIEDWILLLDAATARLLRVLDNHRVYWFENAGSAASDGVLELREAVEAGQP